MRWLLAQKPLVALVACVGSLTSCGDAVTASKPAAADSARPAKSNASSSPGPEVSPVASIAVERAPTQGLSGLVGALERPKALSRVFSAWSRLEEGRADDDVRIVQFGDSHTAADLQTGTVRRLLQGRFGDGGRGLVAIGRPWKGWRQQGVRVGMSGTWTPERGKVDRGKLSGDGLYGLLGVGLSSRSKGARAWLEAAGTSRAELAFLAQPKGGAFDVLVDGTQVVRVSSKSSSAASAYVSVDMSESSAHQLEIRPAGDGDVRVFGAALDRAEHGVIFDALGINGARIQTVLSWDEAHVAEQLQHRAPHLVILAYGTNESTDSEAVLRRYEERLVLTVDRMARAVPGAACLLLGPPDRAVRSSEGWVTPPTIQEILATQRRVAQAAGCAFYDQTAAMGGEGAMAAWAAESPPRAQRDRVHLTREGYEQLGSAFASDLLRAYEAWRRDSGLAPGATREHPTPSSSRLEAMDGGSVEQDAR
jgi:lysophospholipase L1-like esterase